MPYSQAVADLAHWAALLEHMGTTPATGVVQVAPRPDRRSWGILARPTGGPPAPDEVDARIQQALLGAYLS